MRMLPRPVYRIAECKGILTGPPSRDHYQSNVEDDLIGRMDFNFIKTTQGAAREAGVARDF